MLGHCGTVERGPLLPGDRLAFDCLPSMQTRDLHILSVSYITLEYVGTRYIYSGLVTLL